ncbi:hypothetical protein [Lysobacter sp. Root690]|uniref:hypothetical protein n=1 Tax=Lysobacter sp. Root690 TaxID=1736588 RepID=UPI0012F914F8|nr:hypothetical protein [Lysobacter sp. Root690]
MRYRLHDRCMGPVAAALQHAQGARAAPTMREAWAFASVFFVSFAIAAKACATGLEQGLLKQTKKTGRCLRSGRWRLSARVDDQGLK